MYILTGVFSGVIFFFAFMHFVKSPREKQLMRENQNILSQYTLLNKQLDEYEAILSDIQLRDDNLYRVIFQADPIPPVRAHLHHPEQRVLRKPAGTDQL